MPDPRDFLPLPPWEGPPIPRVLSHEYEPTEKQFLKPSPEEVKSLLPEYREVLGELRGLKPIKFVESIVVLKCPAPFNPSAQGDYAFTSAFTWDGRTLSRGPSFSYDTMLATGVNPYERIVNVPQGVRVWIATYDGQWGGFWSRVDVYMNVVDFSRLALQIREKLKPVVELTDRQKNILATISGYVASYRREVFHRNNVTLTEMDELHSKGLVDARGVLTKLGRIVAENEEPWR